LVVAPLVVAPLVVALFAVAPFAVALSLHQVPIEPIKDSLPVIRRIRDAPRSRVMAFAFITHQLDRPAESA
jgi:hypothetical protein